MVPQGTTQVGAGAGALDCGCHHANDDMTEGHKTAGSRHLGVVDPAVRSV